MSVNTADGEVVHDPVGYFIQDMTYHGKSTQTRDAYNRVLRRFETFLTEESRDASDQTSPTEIDSTATSNIARATHRDCMAWIHSLRQTETADSTIATYASYLHRFYAYMSQIGAFESNPMTLVIAEMDERIDTNPSRREISLTDMRSFLADIHHPLEHAVIMTLIKTGIRAGELCNLDLRDIVLTDQKALDEVSTDSSQPLRAHLEGRGPSMYVSDAPAVGVVIAGEERTASNKRQRSTMIPIDEELDWALRRWLAIRPQTTSPAQPLFVSTAEQWGKRLTPHMVHHIIETHAKDVGWHNDGGDATENVTPHYFRHFFTTHLRDRTGDRGIVKYLRGDVGGDIIETYTHNWGDRVRDTYEEHIYTVL